MSSRSNTRTKALDEAILVTQNTIDSLAADMTLNMKDHVKTQENQYVLDLVELAVRKAGRLIIKNIEGLKDKEDTEFKNDYYKKLKKVNNKRE